ncbi:unnamed protein product [Brassicogethes aeneus]|uniref:Uncharacterized protein n=1 Tax=Brassicogethes aeneus TaxID=1431903 RepID=A0A9P0BEV3_BRAAE|nr:unnamed protein product [Brassicogethes aeneus]
MDEDIKRMVDNVLQCPALQVQRKIQELFQAKLQGEFEFLVPIIGYLVKNKLHDRDEMNGENLGKVFYNKVIYIRPLHILAIDDENELINKVEQSDQELANETSASKTSMQIQQGSNKRNTESRIVAFSEDYLLECDDVIRFYVVDRCLASITQFKNGLDILDVYANTKKYPEYFIELMCNTKEGILTLTKLKKEFNIIYSEQGSNKRNTESRIVAFSEDYLLECDENEDEYVCSLEEILTFYTCGLELFLPTIHIAYDKFKYKMTYGIMSS